MPETITIEQFRDALGRMVQSRALEKTLVRSARTLAMEGQRHAVFGVTNAPGGLRRRSGALARSIRGEARMGSEGPEAVIHTGGHAGHGSVPYARIHEEGDTIRPKRGKYLSIPIHPSLKTGAGVSRVPGPRQVPDLVFVRSLRGQPLLANKFTGEPWFLLRRQVTIPERPYMAPALEHISDLAPQVISDDFAKLLEARL
jgi:hypothetical protein